MQYFDQRLPIMIELGLRPEAAHSLKGYLKLLWDSNEELNLISRKMTIEELIDNHVIDCLLPLKNFPTGLKKVADFGSGGGLPGVVYAIQFPETMFHLFDKSPLKQEFLKQCQAIAPNLSIHGEIKPDFGQVDLVTSRAFKPIDVILEISRKYHDAGGKYFLLKGRREKIDEELVSATKKFKTLKTEIIALHSPVMDVERHLVLI